MDEISLGQAAYEAYAAHCGGKSIHGEDLPAWAGQSPEIRAHWDAAAEGVLGHLDRMRALRAGNSGDAGQRW